MSDAFAVQAPLASSGVSNGVSRGVSRTGLVPAVNVWQRIDMVAAGQTDNTVGQEDTTAGGSLHALKAAVADMKKLHAISAGEVIATGFECCMHFIILRDCDCYKYTVYIHMYICTCGFHACCMACLGIAGTF